MPVLFLLSSPKITQNFQMVQSNTESQRGMVGAEMWRNRRAG